MRTKALSIFCDSQLKSHEEWLMSRLEGALELDPNESKYYARWLISVMTGSPDEIDPRLEEELFVYNRPSPNANHTDMELVFDKRSPEEIVMVELAAISGAANAEDAVLKIIARLRRRMDSKRRQRINSYVSETSSSSSSTLSTYEDEFPSLAYMPKMDTREMIEEKVELDGVMSTTPARPQSSGDGNKNNNNFRFAFKNPRSKRQQQRQEQRNKKNQNAVQQIHSQTGKEKSQSPKKPKNPETKQPQIAQPKPQEKLDEQSTPTKKRRRRNRRKKKSVTESENLAVEREAVKQIAQNANFDRLSIDEALEFVKNLSGQSDDQELWKNMVQNQHVKYTNGTFFFAPRLNIPEEMHDMNHVDMMTPSITPDSFSYDAQRPTNSWSTNGYSNSEELESEEEQKCLAQAASVAARSAEMIFDDLESCELTGSSYEIVPPVLSSSIAEARPQEQKKEKKESTWALPESFIPMKTADWMSIW